MESLKNFISECSEAKTAAVGEIPDVLEKPESTAGILLITACNDFDNATSKTPLGLEEPHVIQLPHAIRQCFSSSSSLHSFLLTAEGRLYVFGRNDHGQLGDEPFLSTSLLIP